MKDKSIHQLRSHAQALGVEFKWGDTKEDILRAIDEKIRERNKPPEPAPLI
jgi:hypothetical protein